MNWINKIFFQKVNIFVYTQRTGKAMERAFILTLVQENERLYKVNEELAKEKTRYEWVFNIAKPDALILYNNMNGVANVLVSTTWHHERTYIKVRYCGSHVLQAPECRQFALDYGLPKNINYVYLYNDSRCEGVAVQYTPTGFEVIVELEGPLHAWNTRYVSVKDGFNIIRELLARMKDTNRELAIIVDDPESDNSSDVEVGDVEVADDPSSSDSSDSDSGPPEVGEVRVMGYRKSE
jgi:hypothetical protein